MKKSVALRKFIIIANGPFLARDIIMEAIQDRQIEATMDRRLHAAGAAGF